MAAKDGGDEDERELPGGIVETHRIGVEAGLQERTVGDEEVGAEGLLEGVGERGFRSEEGHHEHDRQDES